MSDYSKLHLAQSGGVMYLEILSGHVFKVTGLTDFSMKPHSCIMTLQSGDLSYNVAVCRSDTSLMEGEYGVQEVTLAELKALLEADFERHRLNSGGSHA